MIKKRDGDALKHKPSFKLRDLAETLKQMIAATMKPTTRMPTSMHMINFDMSRYLRQKVIAVETARRGPLVQIPRPHHPLTNEFRLDAEGNLVLSDDKPFFYKLRPLGGVPDGIIQPVQGSRWRFRSEDRFAHGQRFV